MAVTKTQVAELYVSVFDRAPDAAGLAYWVDESGLTIEGIAQSFFDQDETQAKYPSSLSDAAFIEAIYNNMFNHAPDADGLVYWENELTTGNITRGNMILAIANGALGTDDTILANKTEVGLYFANAGLNDTTQAADALNGVNADSASVVAGKAKVDAATSFDLTTGRDVLVGTASDDLFKATDTTYSISDFIDGAEGDDTFVFSLQAAFTDPEASLQNVETVKIINTLGSKTINAKNWLKVEKYVLDGPAGGTTSFSNVPDDVTAVTLDNVTVSGTKLNLKLASGLNDGSDDTLDITLSNSNTLAKLDVGVSGNGGELEIFNITSTSNTVGAELDIKSMDAVVKEINVTGDGALKLTSSSTAKLGKVDASGLSGDFSYTSKSTLSTGETIKSGSGNDTIVGTTTAGVRTNIEGGEGNDSITAAKAGGNIYGGAGKDTLNGAAGADLFGFNYTNDTGITTATADTVATFTSGTDQITIAGLEAGTLANTVTDATTVVASVESAVASANGGILSGKMYVLFTQGANDYLVFDANNDGEADGVIAFVGSSIAQGDII